MPRSKNVCVPINLICSLMQRLPNASFWKMLGNCLPQFPRDVSVIDVFIINNKPDNSGYLGVTFGSDEFDDVPEEQIPTTVIEYCTKGHVFVARDASGDRMPNSKNFLAE